MYFPKQTKAEAKEKEKKWGAGVGGRRGEGKKKKNPTHSLTLTNLLQKQWRKRERGEKGMVDKGRQRLL